MVMVAMLCVSCSSNGDKDCEEEFVRFVHLPGHTWLRTSPCYFKPGVEGDRVSMSISVRHESGYEYSNATLTIDVVDADTLTCRRRVSIPLADRNGNWTSDGFGSLYQCQVPVADDLQLDSTSVILVWQSMGCDTLMYIADVGISVSK